MSYNIFNTLRSILSFCILFIFGIYLVGCTEEINIQSMEENGTDGYITFRCAGMLEVNSGVMGSYTRSSGPKNEEERAVKSLHVFFFSMKDGRLLTTTTFHNFLAYRKVEDASFIKIPTGEGVGNLFEEGDSNIRIVAIANIDATDEAQSYTDVENSFYTKYSKEGKIQRNGRTPGGEDELYEIDSYEKLKDWIYYPRIRMDEDGETGDISKLPESGMPMIGELTNVDLSKKPSSPYVVPMTALMAKVNVTVELQPDQYTDELPLLKITEYGVRNMPIAVPFKMPSGEVKEGQTLGKPTDYADYFVKYDVTDVPMFHKGDAPSDPTHFICDDVAHEFTTKVNETINKDAGQITLSYYTYENINLPDYNALRTDGVTPYYDEDLNLTYPSGVAPANYQRWKSKLAYSDRASALILKGEYTTHQGMKYNAEFTVYMGSNSETDFMVKRNCKYDNYIVIHGLEYIRNSDDDAYTFDGRVNVHSDNPFYLSIVNERKIDAHASALPMDVWFMLRENGDGTIIENPNWDTKITFTVRDHETVDWIRMEKIPRSTMEAGDFKFGTGARNYFTTNLVKSTLKDNGTADGKEHGWKITIDGEEDGSRSRVYFYIDENVPTNNDVDTENPEASNYYGKRIATIDILYIRTDENGDEVDRRERTLDIEQWPLKKVIADNQVSWMEYYEEYLAHNDPLDHHEQPGELYTGLQWGLNDPAVNVEGFSNPEGNGYYQIYTKQGAFAMTQWAINQVKNNVNIGDVDKIYLFNTEPPKSAFHYCYGKNKRNTDGTADANPYSGVNGKGWYMPGIRELEHALVDYYEEFPDFRSNYYWSAAGARKYTLYANTNNYARATKIISIDASGKAVYAESHPRHRELTGMVEEGPGHQLRTTYNRIRAFYRVN